MKIQETEAQFITDYEICRGPRAERELWVPGVERHVALFGHAPILAVADSGFASRTNEHAVRDRGVRYVVLPRQPTEHVETANENGYVAIGAPSLRCGLGFVPISAPGSS